MFIVVFLAILARMCLCRWWKGILNVQGGSLTWFVANAIDSLVNYLIVDFIYLPSRLSLSLSRVDICNLTLFVAALSIFSSDDTHPWPFNARRFLVKQFALLGEINYRVTQLNFRALKVEKCSENQDFPARYRNRDKEKLVYHDFKINLPKNTREHKIVKALFLHILCTFFFIYLKYMYE